MQTFFCFMINRACDDLYWVHNFFKIVTLDGVITYSERIQIIFVKLFYFNANRTFYILPSEELKWI